MSPIIAPPYRAARHVAVWLVWHSTRTSLLR
jgi:hypothetical protein